MYKGKIISDWSRADFYNPKSAALIKGALQAFMSAPAKVAELQKLQAMQQLQAIGGPGDFPTRINEIIEKFHLSTFYDAGFEQIFNIRDFTGTNESGFDILDIEDGLTFSKVPITGKAQIYKMAGTKTSVEFDTYGAGLGWHRTLIDDKKYWTLEDKAFAFRNKWYHDKAAVYYALIDAISATYNVTWTASPDTLTAGTAGYLASRDAATLHTAAAAIIADMDGKGYGIDPANVPFTILCPIGLTARIQRAISYNLQAFPTSAPWVGYKFNIVQTAMLSSSTVYYVCLPKFKALGGNRMDLTIFTKFDEESYTDFAVGWGRYAGAIGDSEQFRRCAIS